jgi:L-iditol 2-dehydrogenase
MKAALFSGRRGLELSEVPRPVAEEGGLIIAVEACGICATDLKIVEAKEVKLAGSRAREIGTPRIPGHELVGKVVEVGRGVTAYHTGDRVAIAPSIPCGRCYYCRRGQFEMCDYLLVVGYDIDGGFAEFMNVSSRAIEHECVNVVPSGLTPEEAALAEPLSCVLNAFELTPVEEGDTVVVIGSGPMGCLHVEVARLRRAAKVILVGQGARRLRMAEMSGADIYLSVNEEDPTQRVLNETKGHGAHVVFVAVSFAAAQQQALALVAKRGRVNLFAGLPRGESLLSLDTNSIHYREYLLTGTHGSTPRQNHEALQLLASQPGHFKNYITHSYPLSHIHEAFAQVRAHTGMKTVVLPSQVA